MGQSFLALHIPGRFPFNKAAIACDDFVCQFFQRFSCVEPIEVSDLFCFDMDLRDAHKNMRDLFFFLQQHVSVKSSLRKVQRIGIGVDLGKR